MLLSFDEFDVRHVEHEALGALALCSQKSLDPQSRSQARARQQPRLGLERDGAHLGLDGAASARFVLLGLVPELELERGDAGRRVAQRAQLK